MENLYKKYGRNNICNYAAKIGDLKLLQWAIKKKKCQWTTKTTKMAVKNGHLRLLRWALKQDFLHDYDDIFTHGIIFHACVNGQLNILKWALDHEFEWDNYYIETASSHGHLNILIWFLSNGYIDSHDQVNIVESAIKQNHVHILEWAIQSNFIWPYDACPVAAFHGHLRALQLARSVQRQWLNTCEAAAACGNLDVLKWARSQGCPWDYTTCLAAARNGHLHVLIWARAEGCRWKKSVFQGALDHYNHHINKWMLQNGYRCDKNEKMEMKQSRFYFHHYNDLQWLSDNYKYASYFTDLKDLLSTIHDSLDQCIYVPDLCDVIKNYI